MNEVGFSALVALPLLACVLACAGLALFARSLFVACLCIAVAGAAASGIVLALGSPQGALATALLACAWTPLLVLGVMLLTVRTAKAGRRFGWAGLIAAAASACIFAWIGAGVSAPAAADASDRIALAVWAAPLLLATAAGSLALLGYGERGALDAVER
jgi:hypothetical protein